jgi:hypothetical protein
MVVTHAHLVEDSAHDVFCGQDDRLKARTRSTIVALDRGMFGYLKELRDVQARWRKAEAVANAERQGVASVDASPMSARPLANAAVPAAKSETRSAATGTPVGATSSAIPEQVLPPLRHAETSVAAAMAVLSPPMPPYAISTAAVEKPSDVPPFALRATRPAAAGTMAPKAATPVSEAAASAVGERGGTAEAAQAA